MRQALCNGEVHSACRVPCGVPHRRINAFNNGQVSLKTIGRRLTVAGILALRRCRCTNRIHSSFPFPYRWIRRRRVTLLAAFLLHARERRRNPDARLQGSANEPASFEVAPKRRLQERHSVMQRPIRATPLSMRRLCEPASVHRGQSRRRVRPHLLRSANNRV